MAEQFSIKAEKREALGTRVSRRLRKSGKLPAVLARKPEEMESKLLDEQLKAHLARYGADEAAANKVIGHGESKPKPQLTPAELASYTLVASTILNLDETVNRN